MTKIVHLFVTDSASSFQLRRSRENYFRIQSPPVMIEKKTSMSWPITKQTNGLIDDNFLAIGLLADFLNVLILI